MKIVKCGLFRRKSNNTSGTYWSSHISELVCKLIFFFFLSVVHMYVYHFMCENGHDICLSDLFFSNNLSKEKKRFSFLMEWNLVSIPHCCSCYWIRLFMTRLLPLLWCDFWMCGYTLGTFSFTVPVHGNIPEWQGFIYHGSCCNDQLLCCRVPALHFGTMDAKVQVSSAENPGVTGSLLSDEV